MVLMKANKMTMLLQREKAKNEAHLKPLRENARKLAFLQEATKANEGTLFSCICSDISSTCLRNDGFPH